MKKSYLFVLVPQALCCALFLGPAIYTATHDPTAAGEAILATRVTAAAAAPTSATAAAPMVTITTVPATTTLLSAAAAVPMATPTTVPATTALLSATATVPPTATTTVPTTTTTVVPAATTTVPATTTTVVPATIPDSLVIQPYYQIVQALGEVHALDSPGGAIVQTLDRLNVLRKVTTLLAIGPTGPSGAEGWYEVLLPGRPNGSTGWVSSDEVNESVVTTAVVVHLGAHLLTLYEQGSEVADYPVGVGTAASPTPAGTFYVIGVLKYGSNGTYGPCAIGTSAFSETLTDWEYGGVIGIHGTSDPSSVGESVSHGCIRMDSGDITQFAEAVSLGTPVFILP
jgi:lipoprotein-anchoring transpeptidase ErfK/SrfK